MTDTPSFPALSDRADGSYNTKAYAFGTHMADTFNGELIAVATNVMQNAAVAESRATSANAAAAMADASAQMVATAAGAVSWVSGTTYAKNALVISAINSQVYRRRIAGAGATDPANDSTNWTLPIGAGSFIPQPVPASSVNLALGNYFTRTMTASQTFTFDNCPQDGYSFTLELTVTAGVATLPTSVKTPDDLPYTLTANKVHELMFVTSNRGARWRLAAATNYAI